MLDPSLGIGMSPKHMGILGIQRGCAEPFFWHNQKRLGGVRQDTLAEESERLIFYPPDLYDADGVLIDPGQHRYGGWASEELSSAALPHLEMNNVKQNMVHQASLFSPLLGRIFALAASKC